MPDIPCPGGGPVRPANYTETIPGSDVRFEMVAIPGGTFTMGSPASEKGRGKDEGPRHPVEIRPFWMGKTEVTWDEYDEFRKGGFVSNRTNAEALAKDVDAVTRPTPPYPDETRGFGREGYPAIGMSHHAAMEYCHWLSKKTGKTYRLPTEAEWEYACRAGADTAYFFGDDPKELGRYAWYGENSDEQTRPVGRKAANPWGLHDMTGNAAEWCIDRYAADAYSRFPPDRPPVGPVLLPGAAPVSPRGPRRLLGRPRRGLPKCRPAGLGPHLEPDGPGREHLVGLGRRLRRLPRRAGGRGAGRPEGAPLPGPQGGALSRSDPRAGRVPPQLRACRNVTRPPVSRTSQPGVRSPSRGCSPAANFQKPAHRRKRR